ncbi:MAG: alpha-glucosidase [Ruminococcaceae bacterium]|nr:alpha-glucosidase [Oscillospiraceae bacterium]
MNKAWYKEMVVYQIWPRSFKDSNGDGIGDLEGIYEKLDYVKSIGIDAIWFSPLFKSANADYGYDISDYMDINPEYGDMETFKKVLNACHERGMKVFMDLVVNHTSTEHHWFKEACKSVDNPYHDYYIWRKGKGKNGKKPPNNWLSTFEGGAWEYVPEVDEYYLHVFTKGQPDLNMDNPKVREEVKNVMKFWLDMGVDGFREDVITYISKREGLPNAIPIPVAAGMEHYNCGPHLYEYLKEFHDDVLSKYDCFTVGEGPLITPEKVLRFVTEDDTQVLKTMFSFDHLEADCFMTDWIKTPFNLKKMKKCYQKWYDAMNGKGWHTLYLENHDHPRIVDRYGSLKYRVESAKMLATMCYLQKGTPFIYQGQEIGMTNIQLKSIDEFKDMMTFNNEKTFAKLGIKGEKFLKMANAGSRENSRTPVQWDDSEYAGFSTVEPWFNLNENYKEINVAQAEADENSILNYYRKLLKFRKEHEVAIYGDYKEHYKNSDKLYVYERNLDGEKILVVCSFSEKSVNFEAPEGIDLSKGELVLANYKLTPLTNNSFVTRPYECRVYYFK